MRELLDNLIKSSEVLKIQIANLNHKLLEDDFEHKESFDKGYNLALDISQNAIKKIARQ